MEQGGANARTHQSVAGTMRLMSPSFRFRTITDDPDDDAFAVCAITAGADWIIRHRVVLSGAAARDVARGENAESVFCGIEIVPNAFGTDGGHGIRAGQRVSSHPRVRQRLQRLRPRNRLSFSGRAGDS